MKVSFKVNKGNKFGDFGYLPPRDYKGDREAIPHIHPIP